jgi:predicted nucleic acid-binding protein
MSGRNFLDTNIFVYAFDISAPAKAATADRLIKESLTLDTGIISYQVVQEFLSVSLRKPSSLGTANIQAYLHQVLVPLCTVQSSAALFEQALTLQQRYKLSWYDSLIVAAALEAKCEILYTEDLQHGQRFDALLVINPFF